MKPHHGVENVKKPDSEGRDPNDRRGIRMIAQNYVDQQLQGVTRQSRTRLDETTPRRRRCGRCREVGHRIETCPLNQQVL
jgi:hypothetical protein